MSDSLPVGTIVAYAGARPLDAESQGWLVCDGRAINVDDEKYSELYDAIGFAWGRPGTDFYAIPDLRGLFMRTQTDDPALDPDIDLRTALQQGGATGPHVGSYQTYGTAPPQETPFEASIPNLAQECSSYIAGCMTRPAKCNEGKSTTEIVSGGDKETRPVNKYVNFVIKYATVANQRKVELPIGSVIAFAADAEHARGISNNWILCDGQNFPPLGQFEPLFDVIDYAHGKQTVDSSENFVLPDYRGYFLRGVSSGSGRDPDASTRQAPYTPEEPGGAGGNSGDAIGSKQGAATGIPVKANMETTYRTPPSKEGDKSTDGTKKSRYRPNGGSTDVPLTTKGGDAETRPRNMRVDYYIRFV